MEELIHVSQAADILEVHPETVRRMDTRGELHSRRDWRGHRVFDLEELLRAKEKRERLVDFALKEQIPNSRRT